MILTHLDINPKLLIKLVASKLKIWAETSLGYLPSPGKSLGRVEWEVVGDQWCGMASRKSHKYSTVIGRAPKVF